MDNISECDEIFYQQVKISTVRVYCNNKYFEKEVLNSTFFHKACCYDGQSSVFATIFTQQSCRLPMAIN